LKLELKDKLHRKEKEAAMLLQVSFSWLIVSSSFMSHEGYVCLFSVAETLDYHDILVTRFANLFTLASLCRSLIWWDINE
jgi:hypothetical protein